MIKRIAEAADKAWREIKWHIVRPLQRFFTGYSYDMAWDPNHHMAQKIYPIFKRFAEIPPHGAPTNLILERNRKQYVKEFGKERVDAYLNYNGTTEYDDELQERLFAHWKEIIQHVLFSLEWIAVKDEDYPDHLSDPNPSYNPDQKEPFHTEPCEDKPEYHQLIFHEDYGATKLNMKRVQEFEQHISKGFELLGLYWRSFWD